MKNLGILSIILLFCVAGEADVRLPDVSEEMMKPEFFIQRVDSPEAIIATLDDIEEINAATMNFPGLYMSDLEKMPVTFDAKSLAAEQSKFKTVKDYYSGGKKVSERFFRSVRKNIENPALHEKYPVKYGFFVRRANIKSIPVEKIIHEKDDPEIDEFQMSSANIAEAVVVVAETRDKKWLHVYTDNCNGWVKIDDIAICRTKREWRNYKNSADFLLVTGDKFSLDRSEYEPAMSGLELHMGTKLPLAAENESGKKVLGREPSANWTVLLPTRNSDGFCDFKQALIPYSRDVNVGYLPYNAENLIRQMYKKLGNIYGWGGMLDSDDCSSYVISVYKCFGFRLPRNSSWQAQIRAKNINLEQMTAEQKAAEIRSLPVGSLLWLKGHIMMLLGSVDEKIYVISALSRFFPPDTADLNEENATKARAVMVNS